VTPTTSTRNNVSERDILALKEVIATRFAAMDKAVEVFNEEINRVPTKLQIATDSLRALLQSIINSNMAICNEHFAALDRRFATMEGRRIELKGDNQRQIEAALVSQEKLFNQQVENYKESALKSEVSFTKQIDALARQMTTADEALSARINVVKESADTGKGRHVNQAETRQMASWVLPLVIVTILNLIGFAIVIAIGK